jgi:hypothetical protein
VEATDFKPYGVCRASIREEVTYVIVELYGAPAKIERLRITEDTASSWSPTGFALDLIKVVDERYLPDGTFEEHEALTLHLVGRRDIGKTYHETAKYLLGVDIYERLYVREERHLALTEQQTLDILNRVLAAL